MRKLIIILLLLSATSCYAADRVKVQVEYRKALWTCPICQAEDIVDLNVGLSNVYIHTCKNGHTFNQSCGAMKEYNGVASYSQEEYDKVTFETLKTEKDAKVGEWIYQIKNPPAYVEPTKAELEAQKADLETQLISLQGKIDEKTIIAP